MIIGVSTTIFLPHYMSLDTLNVEQGPGQDRLLYPNYGLVAICLFTSRYIAPGSHSTYTVGRLHNTL